MGKSSELLSLLKTGNSDAARRLIAKLKKSGKKKALTKELNVPDDSGQTVIHFCAAQNFVEFLQDLAELGASIDIADNKGYTPLHLAARSGRTSAVTALVNRGADPNISSRTGDTALHLACSGGHATSVEALVSENANCTMLNVSGHTPLDLACQGGHAQVVSLLLRSGQFSSSYLQRSDMPHTALLLAAKQGHIECIGLLVKHGFDVNRKLPGSNSGTALHEAALYGKVDAVRYLLQCGADIHQTNSQGLTALDIVNMYTDPRSASQLKQVLQDALAHQARTRIAQQHAVQQYQSHPHQTPPLSYPHQPSFPPHHSSHPQPSSYTHSSHNTPPTPHRQQQGFSYFQTATTQQPVLQQQASSEFAGSPRLQLRQYDLPSHSHRGAAVGGSSVPQHHQTHASQAAGTVPYQQQGIVRDSTGCAPLLDRDTMVPGSYTRSRLQSQTGEHHSQHPSSQPAPPQAMGHVQHIYPRPGSPEVGHKASSGIGGDLAAIIAAKAASRKPMVTSPTRKEHFAEDLLSRSMTVSVESTVMDARYTALRRCSSTSDRSGDSPERSEPQTLPHRSQGGPPSFKPVPPPNNGDRAVHIVDRHMVSSENGSGSDPLQRRSAPLKASGGERSTAPYTERIPQLKKPPSRAPPPSQPEAADNELMAKLLRRQNKMTEAEQAPPPAPEPASPTEENKDEERKPPELQRPPPPPERKTPLMNPQPSQPSAQPDVNQTPSPAVEKVSETPTVPTPTTATSSPAPSSAKPRGPKAPPPKLKEPEPEMTPWQQELAARKARLADHVREEEKKEEEEEEQKCKSNAPSEGPPPIAPKSKRKDPVPPPPSSQPPPPTSQPLFSHLPPLQPPPSHPPPSQPLPSQPALSVSTEEPRLVAGLYRKQPPEAGSAKLKPALADVHQTLPEVKGEAVTVLHVLSSADQMSRSTSLSSLTTTTGTGSPQLSRMEHMAISDWLTSYKLSDYIPLLESNGYETTELLVDITQDELTDLGIHKVGHRKKLISALSNWPQKEHFFLSKPSNVPAWLSVLGLIQYEAVMLDAGYDDIDFICDITIDDLHDLGITKRGHIRRLIRGIGELTELMKEVPIPSAISDPSSPLVSTSANGPTSLAPALNCSFASDDRERSSELRPDPLGLQQHYGDQLTQSPEKVDFVKMKYRLERKMGLNRTSEEIPSSEEESTGASRMASHSPSASPLPQRKTLPQVVAADTDSPAVLQQSLPPPIPSRTESKHLTAETQPVPTTDLPPQLPPKKCRKHHLNAPPPPFEGDVSDGPTVPATWKKYSVEDITAALDDGPSLTQEIATGGEAGWTGRGCELGGNEFDQLAAALHGFELETGSTSDQLEPEPDQLLADIDDMLADLTTHLDTMIPKSSF